MEILKEKYSITELSEILQLTDHALRFYEKEFELNIPKDERGRRYYTTEMANMMYKIKVMRNDGLEIKAIKKLIQEDYPTGAAPLQPDSNTVSIAPSQDRSHELLEAFVQKFSQQLAEELSIEITSVKEYLSREINKSKLELGACVENGMRRLENKMDKHYQDVDRALGKWREKNKKNLFKKLLFKLRT
jgi:DNA-binding transcriptional MerR regulator